MSKNVKSSKQLVKKLKSLGFMRMNRIDIVSKIPMTYFVNYHITRGGVPNGTVAAFNFGGTAFKYRSSKNELTYIRGIYVRGIPPDTYHVVNDLETILALYK